MCIRDRYGGTGLGLAISNNFVKMMGGNISVWSRLGEGTRFTVQLTLKRGAPVEKDRAGANTASGLTDPDTPVSEDLSGLTILLAEDNEINAEIITCILEEGGAKVDSVGDGKAVVEKFTEASEGTYQLIFMDIRMPVLDGMEAVSYTHLPVSLASFKSRLTMGLEIPYLLAISLCVSSAS